MSQVRIMLTVDSERADVSDLLGLIRDAIRNSGGAPEPRAGDTGTPWVLDAAHVRTTPTVRVTKDEVSPAVDPPKPIPASIDESIRQLLGQGNTVKEVARITGLSAAAVYSRRKKLGISRTKTDGKAVGQPAARGRKKATFRCGECSQVGQDPVRCEHCMERR